MIWILPENNNYNSCFVKEISYFNYSYLVFGSGRDAVVAESATSYRCRPRLQSGEKIFRALSIESQISF